MKIKQL